MEIKLLSMKPQFCLRDGIVDIECEVEVSSLEEGEGILRHFGFGDEYEDGHINMKDFIKRSK
jgi:hypothetical protein